MAPLQHPGVVRLVQCYQDGDRAVVQMLELLTGGDLFSRVFEAEVELGEEEVVQLVRQVLTALQYIHDSNIVHLDIKPENIVCKDR